MNEIGKKISEPRKVKGLSQEESSDLSKMNLRTIQRIENNESEPHGKTLRLICEVLKINIEDLIIQKVKPDKKKIGGFIVNGSFLLVLNFALMGVFSFLTLDSEANMNSRLGAFLLSFLIPFFIVNKTQKMNGIERLLKFGTGLIVYIFMVLIVGHRYSIGFNSGLFPCIIIATGVLYYGKGLITSNE